MSRNKSPPGVLGMLMYVYVSMIIAKRIRQTHDDYPV